MKRVRNIALLLLFIGTFSAYVFPQSPNQSIGFVNDEARVLSRTSESALELQLSRIKEYLKLEINIALVKTTDVTKIVDYTLALAANRKFDWLSKPSYGMLIVVAVKDGKYYTQAGRSASFIFNDEYLNRTQKAILVPAFAKKKYYKGLAALVSALKSRFIESSQIKIPNLDEHFERADPQIRLENALQAAVVITDDETAIQGRARLFERADEDAKWVAMGDGFPVVVGKNGLAWAEDMSELLKKRQPPFKVEGDGKAPQGVFNLTYAFGSVSKPNGTQLDYTRLQEFTECVDDVRSSHYNTVLNRMQVGNYDWKSSEKMLAVGAQYDLGVFVAHNTYPIKRGNGSCIFLHIWNNADSGTAGCTAMERASLEATLRWLDPSKNPVLIQLTKAEYKRYRKSWRLPQIQLKKKKKLFIF